MPAKATRPPSPRCHDHAWRSRLYHTDGIGELYSMWNIITFGLIIGFYMLKKNSGRNYERLPLGSRSLIRRWKNEIFTFHLIPTPF